MARRLVILHIDGLGADSLEQALHEGDMPFVQHLMAHEGYDIHRYRCGLPSTTPFVQAGILYGDNSEIPSFRWWDRERRVLVQFGAGSTFKKVADKYFHGCHPLTQDGASIAACYPAGAADDFGIAYQDRSYAGDDRSRSAWNVVLPYVANPVHVADWFLQAVLVLGRAAQEYTISRSSGLRPARAYLVSDVLEEVFVHHITRYAVLKAMREGFSPIYAGFYAFDETGHAFGPDDRSSLRVLRHVDRTIKKVAAARGDHKAYGPPADHAAGQVNVTSSGGLAHLYFAAEARRLGFRELTRRHPDLAVRISSLDEVALLMARDGDRHVFMKNGAELEGDELTSLLAGYDDPAILRAQLSRLNSFEASGDLVVFGSFIKGRQVNFENQAGGHGSIGGEQLHPFVLAKKEWGIDTSRVTGAHEIHPILSGLRDRLAAS